MSEKESFQRAILLTTARLLGIALSFLIPIYLSRSLEVAEYGTYKQIILLFWFSQVALNLGLDDSAYYYLRWDPKRTALYCFNALIFNTALTTLLGLGLYFFRDAIGAALNNPELPQYLPWLGLLIFLTINSMILEGILLGLNHFRKRLYLEIGTELLKAVAILAAFYFWGDLFVVLYFLCTIMGLRFLATLDLIHTTKVREGLSYRDAGSHFMAQLKYGLPLGATRVLQNILNMEKLLISSFFSLRDYTYYSVGSFENPIVNASQASFYELANIEMVDAMKREDKALALEIWRNMIRKLSLIVVPILIFSTFFATPIITLVFSEKYLSSVPYFIFFNVFVLVNVFNPEPLFRATSQTTLNLKIKGVGLTAGAALLVVVASYFNPMSVLIAKTLTICLLNGLCLYLGVRLLDGGLKQLFRWAELAKLIALSLGLSLFIFKLFGHLAWHPFFVLAVSFSVYGVTHFILSYILGLIQKDELDHLFKLIKRLKPRLPNP